MGRGGRKEKEERKKKKKIAESAHLVFMLTGLLGKSGLQRSCLGKRGRPRSGRTVLEAATTTTMMMMMVMMTGWIFEHLKKPLIFLSWKQKDEGGNWARNPRVPVQVMLEKMRLDFALLNGIEEEEEEIRDGGEE